MINSTTKKKISLDELTKQYKATDYSDLVNLIKDKIKSGEIEPIKTSKTNGKKPALYNRYWLITNTKSNEQWNEELNYKIHPRLNTDYYKKNPANYKRDRDYILKISSYLYEENWEEATPCSVNERSFEIFGEEKYLLNGGKLLLKNLSFSIDFLNTYETREPLAYYSHHKETPQNILIIENKDTFYSIRKHLLTGNKEVFSVPVGTIIYGRGKGIVKSFADFDLCAEPYMKDNNNTFLYFGDLDYEGLLIYESFYKRFSMNYNIKPFVLGYKHMLTKSKDCQLPYTKEGQQDNTYPMFYKEFDDCDKEEIEGILAKRKYIPQEIIKTTDM